VSIQIPKRKPETTALAANTARLISDVSGLTRSQLEQTRAILDYETIGDGDNMRVDVVYSVLPHEVADRETP
jgi:hypothetical protein